MSVDIWHNIKKKKKKKKKKRKERKKVAQPPPWLAWVEGGSATPIAFKRKKKKIEGFGPWEWFGHPQWSKKKIIYIRYHL